MWHYILQSIGWGVVGSFNTEKYFAMHNTFMVSVRAKYYEAGIPFTIRQRVKHGKGKLMSKTDANLFARHKVKHEGVNEVKDYIEYVLPNGERRREVVRSLVDDTEKIKPNHGIFTPTNEAKPSKVVPSKLHCYLDTYTTFHFDKSDAEIITKICMFIIQASRTEFGKGFRTDLVLSFSVNGYKWDSRHFLKRDYVHFYNRGKHKTKFDGKIYNDVKHTLDVYLNGVILPDDVNF